MGPEIALAIASLAFGLMGVGALVRPEAVARQFGIDARITRLPLISLVLELIGAAILLYAAFG